MPTFDREKELGYKLIAGVDEAGRGPLAGRVYASAVILPQDNTLFHEINDSKKLSAKKRDILYDFIINNAISYAIAYATNEEIDEINIRNASFLAMRRAVKKLKETPEYILIDGNAYVGSFASRTTSFVGSAELPCEYECIVKGDSRSTSIAAASILAKVARDRYMEEVSTDYPEYGFAKHKGYGTKQHYEAIAKYGILDIHRKSFRLEKEVG